MAGEVQAWGITDGSAGMVSQVRGLLDALGLTYEIKRAVRRTPYVWLPNAMAGNALRQLAPESDALTPPWPAKLVVTCGRRSAPLGLAIRAASGGRVKAVHIGHPQGKNDRYDLIIAMQHDRLYESNVIDIRCALHAVTQAKLAEAHEAFHPQFAGKTRPFIAFLVGGSTNKYHFDQAAQELVWATIEELLDHTPATLLVTASRRTGERFEAALRRKYNGFKRVWIADRGEHNPYLGFLSYADFIVVTNDSVNMMSEALATGKPVYILKLPGHVRTKPERFAHFLVEDKIARFFALPLASWHYPDCNETPRVAAEMRERLEL